MKSLSKESAMSPLIVYIYIHNSIYIYIGILSVDSWGSQISGDILYLLDD